MLEVSTTTMRSDNVKGLGLFATEYIPSGKVIWKLTWAESMSYPDKKNAKQYEIFGWYDMGLERYVIPKDNGRYIRTSCTKWASNLDYRRGSLLASRDIYNREEILAFYPEFMNSDDVDRLTMLNEEDGRYIFMDDGTDDVRMEHLKKKLIDQKEDKTVCKVQTSPGLIRARPLCELLQAAKEDRDKILRFNKQIKEAIKENKP